MLTYSRNGSDAKSVITVSASSIGELADKLDRALMVSMNLLREVPVNSLPYIKYSPATPHEFVNLIMEYSLRNS